MSEKRASSGSVGTRKEALNVQNNFFLRNSQFGTAGRSLV
jgi:hypothetical protein